METYVSGMDVHSELMFPYHHSLIHSKVIKQNSDSGIVKCTDTHTQSLLCALVPEMDIYVTEIY